MALIIHIGSHRTGTTAIQWFLSQNVKPLLEKGYIYPDPISSWLGHADFPWAFDDKNYRWQDKSYSIHEVMDYYVPFFERSRLEHVVLSSEEFWRLGYNFTALQELKSAIISYDPFFLGYVRKPLDFLLSRYRQEVTAGQEYRGLVEFLRDFDNLTSADYWGKYQAWQAVFGDRVYFRKYDNASNIISDFAQQLGFTTDGLTAAERGFEAQLSINLCDFARSTLKQLGPTEDKQAVISELVGLGARLSRQYGAEFDFIPDTLLQVINSIPIHRVPTDRSLPTKRTVENVVG